MIYYVSDGRYVKIGYTRDEASLARRLSTLQVANPKTLAMVLLLPGGSVAREQDIHAMHEGQHERGEWFRAEGSLAWAAFEKVPEHYQVVDDLFHDE